jgi:hypothetical protein
MTDADLGEWEGVTVDAEGRVIKLELFSNNLSGPLPRELGQLSALQVVILFDNKLTGAIPTELGQLEALTTLRLSYNQMSGPIPTELRQLGALIYLNLNYNKLLTGRPIPAELRQLGALTTFYLRNNQRSGQMALCLHLLEHNPRCRFVGFTLPSWSPLGLHIALLLTMTCVATRPGPCLRSWGWKLRF